MHGATIRPYFHAGVALVGASVIAAAPLAPAPPHIALPAIRSAEVALTSAADAYAQLVDNTFRNVGTLANQAFQNGVAPLLTQFLKNQLTLVQGLGSAAEQALQISNPSSVPAVLQKALSEIAAGQFQAASETISTGVIQVAFPFLPSLLQPLNNFVAVVNQLPNIVLIGSLAVIQPPLALVQATGQAVQAVADALAAGDPSAVVNAIVSAPAVMINGFLNGYAPTQTGGLLTPGLGTLSLLVNIRDLIVTAITPAAAATATTAATNAVTSTTTAAKVVTLDVAPEGTAAKSTDTSSATTETAVAEGQAADTKDAAETDGAAATAATDETSGKTTASTPAAGEAGSSSEATASGSAATGDTSTPSDAATKGDTTAKSDTTSKDDSSSAKGSDSDTGSASTAKSDSASKASDAKKDSSEKAATAKADKR
jgi:hypothetical protein